MRHLLEQAAGPQELRRLAVWLGDELDQVLSELWSDDREKAITLAEVGERPGFLAAALADAEPREQARILSARNLREIPTDALVEVMADAPAALRTRIYRSLRRNPQPDKADALVVAVGRQWGDRDAARVLPSCSPQVVAENLPELAHAVTHWRPVATRHPGLYLDELERQLSALPALPREQCWRRHEPALAVIASHDPERLLDLLERFATPHSLPAFLPRSRVMARADPGRYIRLLLGPGRIPWFRRHQPSANIYRILAETQPPELVEFGDKGHLAQILRALPPRDRESLYDESLYDAKRRGQGLVWITYRDANLALLPEPRRHREARQRVEMFRRNGNEDGVRETAAYLPLDEARVELEPAMHSADADERAKAYDVLLRCAAGPRSAETMAGVLAEVTRHLRNEQDPVRSTALEALSQINPALLGDSGELDELTRDALHAPDRSAESTRALETLALRVLRRDAPARVWALNTLTDLFAELGSLPFRLDESLQAPFWRNVRPFVQSRIVRGDFAPVLRVARSFDRHARHIPELQEHLRTVIEHGGENEAAEAVAAWLRDPRHRSERVAEVLRIDPSTIALDPVQDAVFTRRPDLFRSALATETGRFLPAGQPWVPFRTRGGSRLSTEDSELYAERLEHFLADADTSSRIAVIRSLARIPGGRERIEPYVDSADTPLAEAALAALARTDEPEASLLTQLSRASDDRARVALAGAMRCARFVRPSRLADMLRTALHAAAKVTSRKRLVRATAFLGRESTMDLVLPAWQTEHQSVRASCVTVATRRLDDPRSWTILRESLGAATEITEPLFAPQPLDIAEKHRRAYASLLAEAARQDDHGLRRPAAKELPYWNSFDEGISRWLVDTISDLDARQPSETIQALCQLVTAGEAENVLITTIRRLIGKENADHDALAERDRPARQRLRALVLQLKVTQRPTAPRETMRRASEVLQAEGPEFRTLAADLLGYHTLRTGGPDEFLVDLREAAELLHDRPVFAAHWVRGLDNLVSSMRDPEALLPALRTLVHSGSLVEGIIAGTLCGVLGTRRGWTEEFRELLRELRRHPEPEVADAALAVYTAPE